MYAGSLADPGEIQYRSRRCEEKLQREYRQGQRQRELSRHLQESERAYERTFPDADSAERERQQGCERA